MSVNIEEETIQKAIENRFELQEKNVRMLIRKILELFNDESSEQDSLVVNSIFDVISLYRYQLIKLKLVSKSIIMDQQFLSDTSELIS